MSVSTGLLLFGKLLGPLVVDGESATTLPELILPHGHTAQIECLAVNNAGSRLVTGSSDQTAIVWDVNTGKKVFTLYGHHDDIASVEFSKDDKLILTAAWDGAIIWDALTGKQLRHISTKMWLDYARFNFDGTKVLTGSESSGYTQLWSVKDSTYSLLLPDTSFLTKGFNDPCDGAFSPDGKYIAAVYGQGDPLVRVWDANSGRLLYLLHNEASATRVEFSSNSKFLISGEDIIWDMQKGVRIGTTRGRASFNSDGTKVLSCERTTCQLSDILTGNILFTVECNPGSTKILETHFSANGKSLVILTDFGEEVHDAVNGSLVSGFDKFYPSTDKQSFRERYELTCAYTADSRLFARVGEGKNSVMVWDVFTGSYLREIRGESATKQCGISPDGSKLLVIDHRDTASIYDLLNAKYCTDLRFSDNVYDWEFSPDSKTVVGLHMAVNAGYYDQLRVWKVASGQLIQTLFKRATPKNFCFSPDGKYLSITYYNSIDIWNTDTWMLEQELLISDEQRQFEGGNFTSDTTSYMAYTNHSEAGYGTDGRIEIWNWRKGKRDTEIKAHGSGISRAMISSDGKQIVSCNWEHEVILWDVQTGKMLHTLTEDKYTSYQSSAEFSPQSKFVIVHDRTGERDDTLRIFDAQSGTEVVTSPSFIYRNDGFGYYLEDYKFNPDESEVWFDYGNDTVSIVYTASAKQKAIFNFKGRLLYSDWTSNISTYDKGEYLNYNFISGKERFRWVILEENNYVWLLTTGEYLCSQDAARSLSWKKNGSIFEFDQWDVQYNRPDKILSVIGNRDTNLISLYRNAYLKRVRNLAIDTQMFTRDFHIPEISVLNSGRISNVTTEQSLLLDVLATETAPGTLIDRIIITVNGVPIYGTNGLDVSKRKLRTISVKVPLVLSEGNNIIKVSCVNNRAAESLRQTLYTTYAPLEKRAHKRYYIGIGVSEYKDSDNNLVYAVKDATDLSTAFLGNEKETEVYLLLNDSATRENIINLKKNVLSHTDVDDEIILSFSGHGITDIKGNFYFGTWDIDFKQPEQGGISYSEIEWLLDSIPARKKLVLMDACHSGALDKDVYTGLNHFNDHHRDSNIRAVGLKGVQVDDVPVYASSHSFELMQTIFSNMTKSNGATFISASAGTEFAYEGRDWRNGVFTYSVLSGLQQGFADANNDGSVQVGELKSYVGNTVLMLTNGLQRPVTRSENFDCDWVIWKR